MTTHAHPRLAPVLSTALLVALGSTGCKQLQDPVDGSFESALGSETMEPVDDDVGPGALDPGECLYDAKDEAWGYKQQCDGWVFAMISGSLEGEPFAYPIPNAAITSFGPMHEPYADAKVIACCGLPVEGQTFDEQPHFANACLLDLRQQACISLSIGLAKLIEDGTVPPLAKPKAKEVQAWLADNTTACIQGLGDDGNEGPNTLDATWLLPEDGPWAPQLSDVQLEVTGHVKDIHAPEGGPAECLDLHVNNHTFFGPTPEPFGTVFDLTLDEGRGEMVGPVLGGGEVHASGEFMSLLDGCAAEACSRASVSTGIDQTWSIDAMLLHVDGDLVLTNGVARVSVEHARLELYGPARGSWTGAGTAARYAIPAGDAHFIVVGRVGDDWTSLNLRSRSPIMAQEVDGEWSVQAFELEYLDDEGALWLISIEPTRWL